MRINKLNKEVLYAISPTLEVGNKDIEFLKDKSKLNKRRRIRLCMHKNAQDNLHEMFIVHAKGAYIRPHKHINKAESLHVIEGLADVVIFDNGGDIIKVLKMGGYSSNNAFYYRYPDFYYHTLLIRSDFLVFHEVTNGPFRKSDTVFAPWSPDEGDCLAVKQFMEKVLDKCRIGVNGKK